MGRAAVSAGGLSLALLLVACSLPRSALAAQVGRPACPTICRAAAARGRRWLPEQRRAASLAGALADQRWLFLVHKIGSKPGPQPERGAQGTFDKVKQAVGLEQPSATDRVQVRGSRGARAACRKLLCWLAPPLAAGAPS